MTAPPLTKYELERQANIERNKELLRKLGLEGLEVAPSKAKEKALADAKIREERTAKKRFNPPSSSSGPRRKSARLASQVNNVTRSRSPDSDFESGAGIPSSDPIDFLSHSNSSPRVSKRVISLRRLSLSTSRMHEVDESREDIDEERGSENEIEERDENQWAAPPTRDSNRTLRFRDSPHFTPNLTPEEIIRAGSFGGTAFQRHYSSVLKQWLSETDFEEFPEAWYSNLDTSKYLTAEEYDKDINRYRVRAGQSLKEWEANGWVHKQDPRGWIQWYFRFYIGRRSADDERQIKRWIGVCGPNGRFRKGLVKRIAEQGGDWDDESISPILRQTLQHWGYKLTEADYHAYL